MFHETFHPNIKSNSLLQSCRYLSNCILVLQFFFSGRRVSVMLIVIALAANGPPGQVALPRNVQLALGPVELARGSRPGFVEIPSTMEGGVMIRTK